MEPLVGQDFPTGDELHATVVNQVPGKKFLHFLNGHGYRVDQSSNTLTSHTESRQDEKCTPADDSARTHFEEGTESQATVATRLGQGRFRTTVLDAWGQSCAVTGTDIVDVIRASHIKPWRDSNDDERIDPDNGLPLVATLDCLFDSGLVTFGNDGKLIWSERVSNSQKEKLGLLSAFGLHRHPNEQTQAFLSYHRNNVFKAR